MEKTLYTMAEIKAQIRNLQFAAIQEFNNKLEKDFEKHIEDTPEISLDIKTYEHVCEKLSSLETKYESGEYRYYNQTRLNPERLKANILNSYKDNFDETKQKIINQFQVIENRLARIRKPDSALEFLKLCGIELPQKVEKILDVPVDPEFIKSILPKQKMLGDGNNEQKD